MKEIKLSLFVSGYILSFLTLKNPNFILLDILLLTLLIIKKMSIKSLILGVFVLFLRISVDYLSSFNEIDSYFVLEKRDTYAILINNNLQKYLVYDLENINQYAVIKVIGTANQILPTSNFEISSFSSYLANKNITKEIKITSYEVIYLGDSFKEKFLSFLNNGSDETTLNMTNLFLFGVKNDKEFYNNLIKIGVVQTVVVSGFHFNALESVLGKIRFKFSHAIISVLFFFYLYLLSFPVAATRAFAAYLLRLFAKKFKFLNNFYNYLLTLIMFLLTSPYYILQEGFILSFFLTFVLIYLKDLRINKKYKALIVYFCALPVIISLNNEIHVFSFFYQLILTLPITILYFFSWIVLFLRFLAPIYCLLTNFFVNLCSFLERIGVFLIFPNFRLQELIIYFIILYLIAYFLHIKLKKKVLIMWCIFSLLIVYKYNDALIYEESNVTFFDVGQGDSTLISLGHNKGHILIDTGGNKKYDYANNVLIPYFKSKGIRKLNYAIITHDDFDHNGALESLCNNFKVNEVIYAEDFKTLEFLDFKLENLNYDSNMTNDNEKSGVLLFELFNKKFLIMGDASVENEKKILGEYELNIDYLRVGHHGSNTSSSYEFLNSIDCQNAIISVGRNNIYGHPHKEVIDNLEDLNYKIFRTDKHGMIIITSNRIRTCFDV